ncbi:uncharacterized protein LOC105832531 [Monomorium pharaonis]|uniref:uncharacterized protein LOC105832531 n=1 Tax=Monomorium pharaonis TaxID=307658 RepID=UPI00063FA393|nr:uncharacterized protein LOC105832531 [Monomorium pharaonis]
MQFAVTIMASMLLVKRRLATLIKRFKFEELESAVMPIFPEISWTRVRSKLVKNHKNFTVVNALRVIEDVLEHVDLREKDLWDRLAMLEVIDISRHNKRKIWYGYELTGSNETARLEKRDVQESIKEEFYSNGLNMAVKATMYDNITFIYVKEEKKRRQSSVPTFFALFLGHKYFFCSRKIVPLDYIKVIAISLGYENSKRIKLMGKDLKSLIKLLWFKQQGTLHADYVSQPPVFQPSDPVISNNGVDYTQSNQRKKYAERCFGKDPPTLEVLVIKGPKESIQHDSVASKLPSENSILMNWEFRSRNIARFLTALIEKGAFKPQLPDYISDLMILGKNELRLQTD